MDLGEVLNYGALFTIWFPPSDCCGRTCLQFKYLKEQKKKGKEKKP